MLGIVTVYGSENCGSFLQAYALQHSLQQLQKEVACVQYKFDDNPSAMKKFCLTCAKAILKGNFSMLSKTIQKRKNFKQAICTLRTVPASASIDCCVLGSDTVWDVSTSFFNNHHSFFWGLHFQNAKLISYAPSVGFSKQADIEKCDFIRDALSNMSSVSVRDQNSKELLQPYCDKEIQIVCDPTYLLDRSEYDAIAKPTDLENFLFIYYYGKMPADYKESIQNFAKENGMKTVTFGAANPWCDVVLAYDPLLFLSIYDKADYIITNTFHGTVFSTIYEKRFAVTKNEKPKILDVLRMCGMSDKMTGCAEDIPAILHSDFDYAVTRQNILQEREKGLQYLKTAIEG